MTKKKKTTLGDMLSAIDKNLEKTEKSIESSIEKLEKRLEGAEKSIEKSVERLETRIENRLEQLDKWFQNAEEKLDYILEVEGLKKHFQARKARGSDELAVIKAVDGVDLGIVRGETLGIVGESGCGKSTIARMMIGLIPPSEGRISLFGRDISNCTKEEKKELRRRTGIVFQDPYGSLDPRMTVADIVGEPLRAHKLCQNKTDRLLKVLEIMEACGLTADDMFKFPHQFSGGQRQRICIARALVAQPDIVVCDEAVSALDVSIQAQIINLLCDLRDERGLTYIFISHDLEVVRFISDRIAVMYLGKVVELASRDELFDNPLHPYTAALLNSAPVFGRRETDTAEQTLYFEDREPQAGGCRYWPRCPAALPECAHEEPELRMVSGGHAVACHLTQNGTEGQTNG